jgi:hypothetical protein
MRRPRKKFPPLTPGQSCSAETFSEGTISATLQCDPDGAGKYTADFVNQMGGSSWAGTQTQYSQTGSSGNPHYISNDKGMLAGIWVDDQNDITSLANTSSDAPAGSGNTYFALAEEALHAAAHFGVKGAALTDANFVILQPPAYGEPNAPGNSYYDGVTNPGRATTSSATITPSASATAPSATGTSHAGARRPGARSRPGSRSRSSRRRLSSGTEAGRGPSPRRWACR